MSTAGLGDDSRIMASWHPWLVYLRAESEMLTNSLYLERMRIEQVDRTSAT
jgi:hypothetical protein